MYGVKAVAAAFQLADEGPTRGKPADNALTCMLKPTDVPMVNATFSTSTYGVYALIILIIYKARGVTVERESPLEDCLLASECCIILQLPVLHLHLHAPWSSARVLTVFCIQCRAKMYNEWLIWTLFLFKVYAWMHGALWCMYVCTSMYSVKGRDENSTHSSYVAPVIFY